MGVPYRRAKETAAAALLVDGLAVIVHRPRLVEAPEPGRRTGGWRGRQSMPQAATPTSTGSSTLRAQEGQVAASSSLSAHLYLKLPFLCVSASVLQYPGYPQPQSGPHRPPLVSRGAE